MGVSWNDAKAFCRRLSELEGRAYRLPTEAEWEYAARAGTHTKYSFGNNPEQLKSYAWFYMNAGFIKGTYAQEVGKKSPNPWGLYDMHGNVWQWCEDWMGAYPENTVIDPTGPPSGTERIMRGGSWESGAFGCRSAVRGYESPKENGWTLGFRVVAVDPKGATASVALAKVAAKPAEGDVQAAKVALAKLGKNKKLKVERKGVIEPFLGKDASLVDPPEIIDGFAPAGAVALVRQEVAMGASSAFTSAELIICEGGRLRSLYEVGGESRFGGTLVHEEGKVISRIFTWTDDDPNCCPSFAEDRVLTFQGGQVVAGAVVRRRLPK
jgi:hypothetical protein